MSAANGWWWNGERERRRWSARSGRWPPPAPRSAACAPLRSRPLARAARAPATSMTQSRPQADPTSRARRRCGYVQRLERRAGREAGASESWQGCPPQPEGAGGAVRHGALAARSGTNGRFGPKVDLCRQPLRTTTEFRIRVISIPRDAHHFLGRGDAFAHQAFAVLAHRAQAGMARGGDAGRVRRRGCGSARCIVSSTTISS